MSKAPSPRMAAELWQGISTAWRAFRDPHVALWKKVIPITCLAYVIWPMDVLADPILGLGQIDDLALVLIGLRLFVDLAQPDLNRQPAGDQSAETIDGLYHVVDDPNV